MFVFSINGGWRVFILWKIPYFYIFLLKPSLKINSSVIFFREQPHAEHFLPTTSTASNEQPGQIFLPSYSVFKDVKSLNKFSCVLFDCRCFIVMFIDFARVILKQLLNSVRTSGTLVSISKSVRER